MSAFPLHRRAAAALLALSMLTGACSVHRLSDETAGGPAVDSGETTTTMPGADPDGTTETTDFSGTAGDGSGDPGSSGTTDPGRTPTGNSTDATPRRASDRGVTADAITLGILHTADSFITATGGSTKNVQRVIAPFIKEINANGGINGRQVVPKISTYDPLSADSMRAACVEQAEDHKVFSSIAQIGFYGDAEICMATKEVPLLTGNNSTRKTNVERERGFVRQTNQNKDRNIKIWIDWMISSGLLTKATRTGLLYVDVPEDRDLVNEILLPYLASKGMPRPELATLSSSIAQTPAEAQAAVLRFNARNVQLVLPLVSFLRMLIFTEQAEAASYRPEYSVSDFGLLATDAMAGMPASQWTGVRGITVTPTGVGAPGALPPGAAFADCYRTYKRYGEDFAPNPDDESKPEPLEVAMMMHYCEHLALWADVARRAGVNPTRRSFLDAFDQTGTWSHRVVLSERLTFSPTKLDGADLYAVVEWKPGCTADGGCYRQIQGFRLGKW